jgi:quercetin dioxygenase-like cupin family protein
LVEPPAPKPVKVARRAEGAVLWSSQAGGRGVLVAGTHPSIGVELWEWTLAPGDQYTSEAHTPGTKELVHVQEGTVVVGVGEESVTLWAGDAGAFPGDVAPLLREQPHPPGQVFSGCFRARRRLHAPPGGLRCLSPGCPSISSLGPMSRGLSSSCRSLIAPCWLPSAVSPAPAPETGVDEALRLDHQPRNRRAVSSSTRSVDNSPYVRQCGQRHSFTTVASWDATTKIVSTLHTKPNRRRSRTRTTAGACDGRVRTDCAMSGVRGPENGPLTPKGGTT